MKTFLRNLAFGLVIGLPLVLIVAAGLRPVEAQRIVVQIVTTTTDLIEPDPTPTPTAAPVVLPTSVPTIVPPPVQVVSPEPTAFPEIPPQLVVPTPGAAPTAIAVPQTAVFVGANVDGDRHCPCKAPLTIEWLANFQGGFVGITPTFKWSDGGTGQTDTMTYTTPGTYHSPTVQAYEVYQGVTYMIGTANANITFEIT